MSPRLRGWAEALGDAFWLRPALVVAACALLGEAAVRAERAGWKVGWLPDGWVYAGGTSGARDLLAAVAASTIGVAGTTFSITVAALTLASGQMGPRLLRNFVRDPGNQLALGVFLGTFAYALVLLRTVRSADEGPFVPALGVSGALLLALLCVGTLVWFVHHIATGINVETVIELVHEDLSAAVSRLTLDRPDPAPPAGPPPPGGGAPVLSRGGGYLRALDEGALADWAAARDATLVLLVRPGDYVFPGSRVAEAFPAGQAEAAATAVADALSLGTRQAATQDLEFAVRQLVEVAVRALSPGINDPFTAIMVLDRLGAVLCEVAPRHLPGGAVLRAGRAVLLRRRATDYDGLCDAMFHMIRQYAADGSPAVLIRLLETLARAAAVETRPERRAALRRHADLALAAGRAGTRDDAALADLEARRRAFPGEA